MYKISILDDQNPTVMFVLANRKLLQENKLPKKYLTKEEICKLWEIYYKARLDLEEMCIVFDTEVSKLKFLLEFS